MDTTILIVFAVVYAGMLLGRLPRLQLDRTGVALLGAIALVATGTLDLDAAARAIDIPTIALLFAFMVISAQLRLGGFYARVVGAVAGRDVPPERLLAFVIVVTAALSAVFTNDVVCLAAAPVLIHACRSRGLDPVPFLLALACASNVGSAATLIGNPQNILIGQVLHLSFTGYLLDAALPSVAGLAITWVVIARQYRRRWSSPRGEVAAGSGTHPDWNRWQATKGLAVTAVLLAIFLFTGWPRDVAALAAAAVLLCSRRMHSREMLGLVDWQLLVLFCGLFVVNRAVETAGFPARAVEALAGAGIAIAHPAWLYAIAAAASNVVSNVPAVMMLLPFATSPSAGPVLALSSTLAGNFVIVGSIANIIVVGAAADHGIAIDWRTHARTGVVVTLLTLAEAALLLWMRYTL